MLAVGAYVLILCKKNDWPLVEILESKDGPDKNGTNRGGVDGQ